MEGKRKTEKREERREKRALSRKVILGAPGTRFAFRPGVQARVRVKGERKKNVKEKEEEQAACVCVCVVVPLHVSFLVVCLFVYACFLSGRTCLSLNWSGVVSEGKSIPSLFESYLKEQVGSPLPFSSPFFSSFLFSSFPLFFPTHHTPFPPQPTNHLHNQPWVSSILSPPASSPVTTSARSLPTPPSTVSPSPPSTAPPPLPSTPLLVIHIFFLYLFSCSERRNGEEEPSVMLNQDNENKAKNDHKDEGMNEWRKKRRVPIHFILSRTAKEHRECEKKKRD